MVYQKKISTNCLITLCEIIDDYKSFCNDLEGLIKSKYNRDLVNKIYRTIRGELCIGSNKYKDFIEKHKHTIEIMNKYSCLSNLTILSYDLKGNRIENLTEDYFYQYIQEHKKNIETIKAVVLKIKKLGFDEINFSEEFDFTGTEYKFYNYNWGKIVFLENIEVNPTYLNEPIKYRTNSSYYRLILDTDVYNGDRRLSKHCRKIELNNLIFDPNKLPNEITTESTIGVIKKLAENKKEEQKEMRSSVDLRIATNDLIGSFEHLREVSQKYVKTNDNQELIDLLNKMQNILTQLQTFETDYEKQIIDSYTDITDEAIKKEIKLYLDRIK